MPRLPSHAARPAQSPVETYLREINETPVLKAEEERSGQTDCDWLLGETLMVANTNAPDAGMVAADQLRQVQELLSKMDEREATVLRMRFGLDDAEPMTLKEIGDRLSLTRERIRQIEKDALSMLREQLAAA